MKNDLTVTEALTQSFSDTLKDESLRASGNIAEAGLDNILNDGVLKNIPFFSTIISIYHIGTGIKDRHNIKKLAIFIDTLNSGIENEVKRKKYIDMIQSNEKKTKKELEYILVLIDRYVGYSKPPMLAKLYLAYLHQNINWEKFVIYAEVVDRLLPLDEELLFVSFPMNLDYMNDRSPNNRLDAYARLVSLGLMSEDIKQKSLLKSNKRDTKHYKITTFGKKFVEIIK